MIETDSTPTLEKGSQGEPRVTAIVLNWNGLEDTLACLATLRESSFENLNIIVVDNGSRTSPASEIAQRWADIDVVELPTNLGYAGGNNVGIRRALANGADFVWVLNNDTVVHPEALQELVGAAGRHPRAGVVGSKVLRADQPTTLWVAWGTVTWRQSLIGLVGEDRPDGPAFACEKVVPWVPGCSLLFRREALEVAGTFDDEFFAYHEDVDWAARALMAGWTSVYCGTATIWHSVHGSSGGVAHYGGFRKYLSARNTVLYARRHGNFLQKSFLVLCIVVTFPAVLLRRSVSGEASGVWMKLRGWRDGLLRRPIPFDDLGLRKDAL